VAITPDDKNWTWVLERPCPECRFDGSTFDVGSIGAALVATGEALAGLLADDQARTRPDDATWSALEYGCHVRDVYRLYEYRLGLMLAEDGAHFPNWDQDATAVEDDYGTQDPMAVAAELRAAAQSLAAAFDRVSGEQWSRRGIRSDGAEFTIDSFARYMVHDPVHHVADVEHGYARLEG
jgi:hypothetical protein